jgi:hypothetical protein
MDQPQVNPIPKETRPWRCPKEDAECTRKEPCRSCRGRRSRRSGRRKQNEGKKVLGVPASRFSPTDANEENWKDIIRWEVKSGAQVGPIATRYLQYEGQSEAARPIGDNRPFGVLVVMRATAFRQLVELARQASETGSSRGQ